MKIIDPLCRSLICCFSSSRSLSPSPSTNTTVTFKKRLSSAKKDEKDFSSKREEEDSSSPSEENLGETEDESSLLIEKSHRRSSKSTVSVTLFGHRRAHVCFCIQYESRPPLVLELSIPTNILAKEMQSGLLRIALKCDKEEMSRCSLHSIPVWTMYCNGRKVGFAFRRKATEKDLVILKAVQCTSVGVGIFPTEGGLMYMRASFQRVVGSRDSESYHLISPGGAQDQELSLFLLRSV